MAQEQSLFGPTVDQVRQQQQQAQQAQMFQLAQLSPGQLQTYYSGNTGNMMGNAANAIGVKMGMAREDPAIEDARTMKSVVEDVRREGTDVSDPVAFYRQVSGKLAAAGKTQAAMGLSLKAAETEWMFSKRDAEVRKLDAEALKALRDKESQISTLIRESKVALANGDTDAAAKIEAQIAKLNTPDAKTTESEEGAGTTKLDGREVPMVKKVLLDGNGKKIWEGTPYAKSAGQQINLNNQPPSDDIGLKMLGDTATDQHKKFNVSLAAANDVRPAIADMQRLLKNPKLIQGSLPELRLEATRALNTLGWGDAEMAKLQSDSDLFDAYARNVILPKMRMLGGSDSNEELKKVEQSFANRKMDLASIRQLVNAAERDMNRLSKIDQAYNDGLAEGRNPVAFNFATGQWRKIKGLPDYLDTPSGTRPVPSQLPGTRPIDGTGPTPTQPTAVAPVTQSDVAKYKAWATSQGADLSKMTDAQIEAFLASRKGK